MRKFKVPSTYVIIFAVLLLCAVSTWFVSGGEPQTWQVFSALYEGFSQQAGIIAFVLVIGGAFWVVNSTKAVDDGIMKFIGKIQGLERYSLVRRLGAGNIVITLVMLLFGIFGAVFGMSEETRTRVKTKLGNVYENNLIGAEWEKAKALRDQYPNVGITFVATDDNIVNWALEQDWIDVVIPYHLVRTGAEVAKAFGYTNYTSESSDTKDAGWTKGKDQKYIAPTEHNNDKATYMAALERNHQVRQCRYQ